MGGLCIDIVDLIKFNKYTGYEGYKFQQICEVQDMKRKVLFALCITMISIIAACGKVDELTDVPVETEEVEDIIETITMDSVISQEVEEMQDDEIGAVEGFNDMLFEPMDEIINSTIYEGKIQIADVIVDPTMTMAEFMDVLSASELDWEFDYSPDQIILGNDRVWFEAFYMNQRIFSYFAYNPSDESNSLKNCLVNSIDIDDEIQNNVFFYNGYSVGGFNVPIYMDYKKELGRDFYTGSEITDTDNNIMMTYDVLCSDYKYPSLMQYEKKPINHFQVIFDSRSGECISFHISTFSTDAHNLMPYDSETEKILDKIFEKQTSSAFIDERFVGIYENVIFGFKMVLNANGTAEHEYYGNDLLWKYEDGRLSIYNRQMLLEERDELFYGNVEPGNELKLEVHEYALVEEGDFMKLE